MYILKKFDMENCKPRATPRETYKSYYKDEANGDDIYEKKYREMVGSLVYSMVCTQPDLSYVVTKLSQHLSKSNSCSWVLLKHVYRVLLKHGYSHLLFNIPGKRFGFAFIL